MLYSFNLCVYIIYIYIYNISKHSLFKPVKQHVVWQLSHSSAFFNIFCLLFKFTICFNWSWNFTRSPYFYNPQVLVPAVYQACFYVGPIIFLLFTCRYTDVYYDHLYLCSNVCIMYNPNLRLWFICVLCYASIISFVISSEKYEK